MLHSICECPVSGESGDVYECLPVCGHHPVSGETRHFQTPQPELRLGTFTNARSPGECPVASAETGASVNAPSILKSEITDICKRS